MSAAAAAAAMAFVYHFGCCYSKGTISHSCIPKDVNDDVDENNTEIELSYYNNVVSISKDRIMAFNSDSNTLKVFWLQNFNEKNLRKAANAMDGHWIRNVKIFNDCLDATMDISKTMHQNLNCTIAVDIKSKGPIVVNANVSAILRLQKGFIIYIALLISFCNFRRRVYPHSFHVSKSSKFN